MNGNLYGQFIDKYVATFDVDYVMATNNGKSQLEQRCEIISFSLRIELTGYSIFVLQLTLIIIIKYRQKHWFLTREKNTEMYIYLLSKKLPRSGPLETSSI